MKIGYASFWGLPFAVLRTACSFLKMGSPNGATTEGEQTGRAKHLHVRINEWRRGFGGDHRVERNRRRGWQNTASWRRAIVRACGRWAGGGAGKEWCGASLAEGARGWGGGQIPRGEGRQRGSPGAPMLLRMLDMASEEKAPAAADARTLSALPTRFQCSNPPRKHRPTRIFGSSMPGWRTNCGSSAAQSGHIVGAGRPAAGALAAAGAGAVGVRPPKMFEISCAQQ